MTEPARPSWCSRATRARWAAASTRSGTSARGFLPGGHAILHATVAGGASAEGLFRFTGTGVVPEIVAGDPVDTPGGGIFTGFDFQVDPNASGDYAFLADVDRNGRNNLNALYVRAAATLREVAFPLEPVPGGDRRKLLGKPGRFLSRRLRERRLLGLHHVAGAELRLQRRGLLLGRVTDAAGRPRGVSRPRKGSSSSSWRS